MLLVQGNTNSSPPILYFYFFINNYDHILDTYLRPWILFYYATFIVLIGVPGWWYFTTIERSHIPNVQKELTSSLEFVLDVNVNMNGDMYVYIYTRRLYSTDMMTILRRRN